MSANTNYYEQRRQGLFDLLRKYDRSIVLIVTALTIGYGMYFSIKSLQAEQMVQNNKIEASEKEIINFKLFMASQAEINKKLQEVACDVREIVNRDYKNRR